MKTLRAAVVGLALVFAGCGYTELHEVVLRTPTAPSGRPIEIYMYGQVPPRPFFEIALLQAIGHGADANLADLVKGLTNRATQLGCDAVIRVQIEQGTTMAHAFGVCAGWAAFNAPPANPGSDAPPASPVPEPPIERAPVTPEGTSL